MLDPDLQITGEEVARLKQEVEQLKQCGKYGRKFLVPFWCSKHNVSKQSLNNLSLSDMVELQKAKEHNDRLDTEIRALRDRVRSLDSERKTLLKMVGYIK